MKLRILFLAALLSFSGIALAQHGGYYRGHNYSHHHGYWGGSNWVAPFIVGGVVTYALTRPAPAVVYYPTPGGYPPVVYGPAAPAPVAYWYYCADAQAYYPYVANCPSPWMLVRPQPQ
jgi:hypothetical protein